MKKRNYYSCALLLLLWGCNSGGGGPSSNTTGIDNKNPSFNNYEPSGNASLEEQVQGDIALVNQAIIADPSAAAAPITTQELGALTADIELSPQELAALSSFVDAQTATEEE